MALGETENLKYLSSKKYMWDIFSTKKYSKRIDIQFFEGKKSIRK